MEFLEKLSGVIPHEAAVVVIIAGALDFIFRMVKTEKPLSLAWVIAAGARKLGEFLTKLASFLDKVLPQKVKSDELPKQ